MGPLRSVPRNARFGPLLETVLVSAVATILVIRTQLYLTDYPQLGGGQLHIAHLLYGGVFMLVAIGALLMFLGRPPRRPAAILGGVGFGLFADELGKFITKDNDYFFRPAAALIYVIFVGLFLLTAALQRRSGLSSDERLRNAVDRLGEATRRRFDEDDRRDVLELLHGADQADPLVPALRRLVDAVQALPSRAPSRTARWAARGRARYRALAVRPAFPRAVAWVFGGWAALSLVAVVELVLGIGVHVPGALPGYRADAIDHLPLVNVLALGSSAVSALLVALGSCGCARGRMRSRTSGSPAPSSSPSSSRASSRSSSHSSVRSSASASTSCSSPSSARSWPSRPASRRPTSPSAASG